ncbi:COPI associated protein-domain-containing protein [Mucor mucedo]|uniref:COPI associated protein-domain-containing protein n=1 Tax=Mucor mucedo TaxID=29922 RepID=UPI00221F8B4E|nr:COPI associated protein-domain-containing protein [Mucor mucedo]KAI7890193.1 COPI associated protein-domain-containing protein [Mucor mucedo]
MNLTLIFRAANIVAAAFMIIGGVMTCIAGGFPNFIQGIFVILFGIMTAIFEFRLPAMITQFASFMFSFLGRGVFYIFIGCITLNYNGLGLASGIIVLVIGVGFVVLQFTHIEAPSNMQKRAYEDAVGYSTQIGDGTSPTGAGFGQDSFSPTSAGNPQYPTANYASPGAV